MSFFGLERGHQSNAPGFSGAHDAFDALQNSRGNDDEEILDFENTFEGFGGQLDDGLDSLNDDTFGDTAATRDYDFSGKTGNVAQAFEEERMRYAAQHAPGRVSPVKQQAKPRKHGYENLADLEVDADLWGLAPRQEPVNQRPAAAPQAQARRALTLEEVEAMMQNQSQQLSQHNPPPSMQQPFGGYPQQQSQQFGPDYGHQQQPQQPLQAPAHPQILQRPPGQQPQSQAQRQSGAQPGQGHENHQRSQRHPQILQRQQNQSEQTFQQQPIPAGPKQQQHAPRQILQNPNRLSGQGQPMAYDRQGGSQGQFNHGRRLSQPGLMIAPQQILNLSEEDRAAFLAEEARRAKRNHKIHLLSKYNGLMTPQDKNFITRIQLQQLVTATGSVDAEGPESLLAEDFYYQVYSQIRGAPRSNPHQPANQFAQTYLYQTGGRYGQNRRHPRGADNHMQRMEQQVQRAVEAVKAKPKNKQLVIEGSLGKISFSNAKTPKPLLNIKRLDSEPSLKRIARPYDAAEARRGALKNIEKVYGALMEIEDHARLQPLEDSALYEMWLSTNTALNEKLWFWLKAYEPIVENHASLHPFVAIVSHPKGKKAIPRVFRHLSPDQRTNVLTVAIAHLDTIDVVHGALVSPLPAAMKEEIELFINTITPVLFSHVNEQPLFIIAGLLGIILSRCDVKAIVRTKVGLSILTMLISKAEVLKENQQQAAISEEWQQYTSVYNAFFNSLEPVLPHLFPDMNPLASDDVYIWQFLAAVGVAANGEQQQRLVLGVKDRVMSSVGAARTLPHSEQEKRLGEVNLFMRALGLDVELLA